MPDKMIGLTFSYCRRCHSNSVVVQKRQDNQVTHKYVENKPVDIKADA